MSSPDALTELVNQLARLPGIGEKTAARLAYFLIDAPPELSRSLGEAILAAPARMRRCSRCGALTEADPCRICANARRESRVICVVETTQDISAIERTGEFNGVYHVLHGLIRPLEGVGPDQLNLRSLVARVGSGGVDEILVATNPSVEGEATAMYLRGLLHHHVGRVTRIASGMPVGGELEYADRATLGRAIAARVTL